MKFFKPSKLWFILWSDMFVNIATGWFGVVLFDPFASPIETIWDIILLTSKIFFGILSLIAAKALREEAKVWK